MVEDLLLALRQMDDPRLQRVLLRGAGACLVLLIAMIAGVSWLTSVLADTGYSWLDTVLPYVSGVGTTVLAWFLFPVVTVGLIGLWLDDVAEAVEARHYANAPPVRPSPIWEQILPALRFIAVAATLNLLALPLFLLLPGLNLVLFLLLNGYLLGREYFEAVAARRLAPPDVTRLRRRARSSVIAEGALVAALSLVPLVNLVAPIIGTAMMVHRYHKAAARQALA